MTDEEDVRNMYICFKDGKRKAMTLSYDDGVVQDIRLSEILKKHGIKCTFNISSGLFLDDASTRERYYGRMTLEEAVNLYEGSGNEVRSDHHKGLCLPGLYRTGKGDDGGWSGAYRQLCFPELHGAEGNGIARNADSDF